MGYDKQFIAAKLERWEKFINEYDLPRWDELPRIQLYMDQVVALISEYLGHFVYEGSDEKLLTPSMVNNYVKLGVVPPPVKKRYSRTHIACLLMVCVLKQTLSMAVVAKLITCTDEAEIRRSYEQFANVHKRFAVEFCAFVRENFEPIFNDGAESQNAVSDLVLGAAVSASLARLLSGKIVALKIPEEKADEPKQM